MAGKTAYSGGCLCGAVRFTVTPVREKFGVCHCATCRKWASGPYFAIGCGRDVEFEDKSDLATYASSQWAERGFCRKCGSSLFYRLRDSGHYQMALGALDTIDDLKFTSQVFIDEKPDVYEFANETRKMTGRQVIDAYLAEKTGGVANNG